MRNLKRALCLALACVMLLGMMVIGASAGYADFTDKDEIVNDEAVKSLVTLGVIAGKDDGSYFDPAGIVTRAEMCKMICVVLNGGVDPVVGTKETPTFTDIKGTWAEAYIEYCVSLGIVAGRGDGTFDPTGTVTGTEAAKMMLVAMGWDADVFELVGPSWGINTDVEANQAGLYEDLRHINASVGMTRDNAAQLIYNGIQNATMYRSWNKNTATGEISESYSRTGDSLFNTKFFGVIYEGVLCGSGEYGPLATAGKERVSVDVKVIDDESVEPGVRSFKCKEDVSDLAGEYVKVLYDSKAKETYGVYSVAAKNDIVLNVLEGDIGYNSVTEIEVDGVKYDVEADAEVYYTGATAWEKADDRFEYFEDEYATAASVKLVDNDGNNKIDVAIVVNYDLETVNYVGSDNMTLTTLGSVKTKDMIFAGDKPVKNDKVLVTPKFATFAGKYGIAVAETVEGKVTEVKKNSGGDVASVKIDGAWYKLFNDNGTLITDDKSSAIALSSTYKLFLKDGYAYAAKIITSGGTEIGMITGTSSNKDFDDYLQTRMLLTDGTSVTGYMKWAASEYASPFTAGSLVAYEISDGRYKLYPIASAASESNVLKAMAGYDDVAGAFAANGTVDSSGAAFVKSSNVRTIADKRVDNGAVVFVQYDSNTGNSAFNSAWKVVSGATVNTWNSNYGDNGAGLSKNSGLGYLEVAVITQSDNVSLPGASSQYAYVTSSASMGSDYASYEIWDGTGEDSITVTEKTSSTNATKGAVIKFDWDGDGVVKNVSVISTKGALTYTNGNQVRIEVSEVGTGYDLADDVVVLNVDSKKDAGVSGNAIIEAAKDAEGMYINNVVFTTNSDGEIALLVIDVVNGAWED